MTSLTAEYFIEYFRGQTRSTHSQQNNIVNAAVGKWFKGGANIVYLF
jgi:hypothetical protein